MRKLLRSCVLGGVVASTAVLATACPEIPPYAGPPTATKAWNANSVTVNSTNDGWNITCFCTKDEPKNLSLAFRVKLGVPNSADAWVVAGDNHWDGVFQQGLAAGDSFTYSGGERATATFSNVLMPDVLDLVQGSALEVVGVWAMKLEDDGILAANVTNVANALANGMESALNATVAAGTLPTDPNQIVDVILDAILPGGLTIGGIANLAGTAITGLLNNINLLSDDVLGSGLYLGVGASGTLAGIINSTGVTIPSLAIPAVVMPPDIGGGAIFALDGTNNFTNSATNSGVDGQHTVSYSMS